MKKRKQEEIQDLSELDIIASETNDIIRLSRSIALSKTLSIFKQFRDSMIRDAKKRKVELSPLIDGDEFEAEDQCVWVHSRTKIQCRKQQDHLSSRKMCSRHTYFENRKERQAKLKKDMAKHSIIIEDEDEEDVGDPMNNGEDDIGEPMNDGEVDYDNDLNHPFNMDVPNDIIVDTVLESFENE